MAARTTPEVATTAHQRRVTKLPTRMRNSPTKPLRPGSPIDDSITSVNTPASNGIVFWSPPSSEINRVCRRSITMPTRRNKPAVDSPWLTICSTPPESPWVVRANVPSTMKPRWAIEE